MIKFAVSGIPRNAVVESASLELLSGSVGFSQEDIARSWQIEAYECVHDWKEGNGDDRTATQDGATVGTCDGKVVWPGSGVTACMGKLLGSTVHEGDYRGWCKWDLNKKAVQEWISGGRPNHGLIICGKAPGKAISFYSSEAKTVANRPILRVKVSYPDGIVPVFSCYNPATAEYFLATSEKERDSFIVKAKQDVALKPSQEDERWKLLEQERLAGESKPPAVSTPASVGERLAKIHLGKAVGRDHAVARKFNDLIRKIHAKCPNTDADTIAGVTLKGQGLMKDKGVRIELLQLMEWLEKSAPEKDVGPYRYEDITAAFVLIAISGELRKGELPQVHTYVRAMLEELVGK